MSQDIRSEEAVRQEIRDALYAVAAGLQGVERRFMRAAGDAILRLSYEQYSAILLPCLEKFREASTTKRGGSEVLFQELRDLGQRFIAESLSLSVEEALAMSEEQRLARTLLHPRPPYFNQLLELMATVQLIIFNGRRSSADLDTVAFCAEMLENSVQPPSHYEALAVRWVEGIRSAVEDSKSILSLLPAWEKALLDDVLTATLVMPAATAATLEPAIEECGGFSGKKRKNRSKISDALMIPMFIGAGPETLPTFSLVPSLMTLMGTRLPRSFAERLSKRLREIAREASN